MSYGFPPSTQLSQTMLFVIRFSVVNIKENHLKNLKRYIHSVVYSPTIPKRTNKALPKTGSVYGNGQGIFAAARRILLYVHWYQHHQPTNRTKVNIRTVDATLSKVVSISETENRSLKLLVYTTFNSKCNIHYSIV